MHAIKRIALCGALALMGGSVAAADTTSGKVSDVNVSAKTFTVTNAQGKSSFSLAKDAKVMLGETASTFDELKPSERVKVDWSYDGSKRVASRIEVKPKAAKAKRAAAPTAKSPAH